MAIIDIKNIDLQKALESMKETIDSIKDDPKFFWEYQWSRHEKIKFSDNSKNHYVKEIESIFFKNMEIIANSISSFYKDTMFPSVPKTLSYKVIYNIKNKNLVLLKLCFYDLLENSILTIPMENCIKDCNFDIVGSFDYQILIKPNDYMSQQLNEIFAEMCITSSGPMVHTFNDKRISL